MLALRLHGPAATGTARLAAWRRRSYAGFYLDEAYTRLALQCGPRTGRPARRPAAVAHVNNPASDGHGQG
jgi:NAD(P)H-quinone oxidoreductase subunit 5